MPKSGCSRLRKGRFSIPGQIYHVVSRTYKGKAIFSSWTAASSACCAFTSSQALRSSSLLCYSLMPDHVHWLLQLGEKDTLADLVRRMKSLSARAVRDAGGVRGKVWHRDYYDRAIRQEEDLLLVARYIVVNPLRADLCTSVSQYPYWDAIYL